MKTIPLTQNKYLIFLFLCILSVFVVSCGSYQNTSYYGRDGIYGNAESKMTVATASDVAPENNQYKNYFESLQDPNTKKDSTFTDVERYSSDSYNNQNSSSNSVWGSDSGTTVVNIYDNGWGWNNYWNWNIGWGWNSWYGPNWGWGWNNWYGPNWGWGWNNWYGNPWCGGYYQPYFQQYHQGTRSFAAVNNNYNYSGNRYDSGRRNNAAGTRSVNNNYSGTRTDAVIRNPRSSTNFGTPRNPIRNSANINSSNTTPRFNSNSAPRSQDNSTRNYNSTPTRSNSSNSGSYNSGGRSSGGNYGGGSSGGGRSSGGRR